MSNPSLQRSSSCHASSPAAGSVSSHHPGGSPARRDFLLEIGCEELPARFIPGALRQMVEGAVADLKELRLEHGQVRALGTPRRLALLVRDMALQQGERVEEVKGPAARVAFDAEGKPTRAAEGFARSQGVAVEELEVRDTPQGPYVFAVRRHGGRPVEEVLAEWLPGFISRLHFPKTMRWGSPRLRFPRPIRWLVALLGQQVVPIEVDGLTTSRKSRGHRLLASGEVEIPEAAAYEDVLRGVAVVVDPEERRRLIREAAEERARALGGQVEEDPELLEEVVHLVEFPTVLAGHFDPDYLVLPPEVLVTAMAAHQRYFPVVGPEGRLLPYFLAVSNGDPDRADAIVKGHERVLAARLADARFFYDEDRKQPLAQQFNRLERVVFQESLGTLEQKARRLEALTGHLAGRLGFSEPERATALRAAFLAKVDLVTKMVYEFPELQGIMGREYARASGEGEPVAVAVFEHVLPRYAGDRLPETRPGAVVALADRWDTLAGYFAIGLAPTGSQDPYGLRRAANGVVLILLEHGFSLPLRWVTEAAVAQYGFLWEGAGRQGSAPAGLQEQEATVQQLTTFLQQRLRAVMIERGCRADVIEAALAALPDDLLAAARRAEALQDQLGTASLAEVQRIYQRVANLAKQGEGGAVDEGLLEHETEKSLWQAVQEAAQPLESRLAAGEVGAALEVLAGLGSYVDAFFEGVLVMAPDEAVRRNRLALLAQTRDLYKQVADWSKLEAQ